MSIQKKSLISALKTTKKANVAAAGTETPKGESLTSMKLPAHSMISSKKAIQPKQFLSGKKAIEPKRFLSGKKVAEAKRFTNMKKTVV
jgi:hypothetical protein